MRLLALGHRRAGPEVVPARPHPAALEVATTGARPIAGQAIGDYGQHMRLLAIIAVCAACAAVAASTGAAARTAASPERTYKIAVDASCIISTRIFIDDLGKLARIAKTGNHSASGRQLGVYLGHGYQLDRTIWRLPVPPTLKTKMAPIRTLLKQQMTLILQVGTNKTTIAAASPKLAAQGQQLDKLFDRNGLTDCGSGMTKKLAPFWKKVDAAFAAAPKPTQ